MSDKAFRIVAAVLALVLWVCFHAFLALYGITFWWRMVPMLAAILAGVAVRLAMDPDKP